MQNGTSVGICTHPTNIGVTRGTPSVTNGNQPITKFKLVIYRYKFLRGERERGREREEKEEHFRKFTDTRCDIQLAKSIHDTGLTRVSRYTSRVSHSLTERKKKL